MRSLKHADSLQLSLKKVRPVVPSARAKETTLDHPTKQDVDRKIPEPLTLEKQEKYIQKIREAVADFPADSAVNWNEEFQHILSKPVNPSIL